MRAKKLDGSAEDGFGALRRGKMAAAVHQKQRGADHGAMHALRDRNRDELVLGSPDDQGGGVDMAEAEVHEITTGGHRADAALNDPGIGLELADGGTLDEGGEWLRAGAEAAGEPDEARGVGGGEQGGIEGGWKVDARGIEDDEPVDPGGVVRREFEGDPATHGPAADVRAIEVHGLHEVENDFFLQANAVVDVGAGGAAKAEQIRNVDMEALRGERRDQAGPVLAARAEAVNEDERNLRSGGSQDMRWSSFKVVNAIAVDLDVLALDVLAPEMEADRLIVDPEGDCGRRSGQRQQQPARQIPPVL